MKNKKIKFELNTPFGKFTDEFIIKMYGFTLGLMFGEELGAKLTKIMCDNKKHGLDINSYCFGFSMACAECGGELENVRYI